MQYVSIPNTTITIGNGAFENCSGLQEVYCYAEKVPSTESNAFDGSYPEYANLHVPHRSLKDYQKTAPWSVFGTIKAISGTDLYTITYILDGTEFHKDTLVAGSSITLPQAPEKEGHTFNGWKDVPETMPANDVVIVGDYSVNKYLLTFKIGDEVLSADSVEYGAKIGTPQAPEKEGHTFNGWKDVPETMPANDVVVVGSYSVNKYLLTFKIGDEVISADSVEYGTKIETPVAPEKEGHTFSGWKDVPETMPAKDVVIVGSYSVNKYLLTFKIGDEVIASDSVEYGAKVETPQVAEKEGHTFNGWKNVPETMPANDVVVVGSYSVNKYLLAFKIGDEVISADSVEYGTKIETPVAPEKEGHTFNGWKDIPETMPANDVVIVGSYSVNKYLLTFKIGDEVLSADSVEYGARIETPVAPEKEGHTFNGWKDVPETMPAKDIIISGSLLINTYKVTYMLNSQVFHTDSVKYGTKLPGAEVPVKEGHIFSGWMNVPEKMPAHDITIIGIFRLDSNNPQENGFLATSISDLRNNVAYTLSTPNHQRCEWPYKEVDYSLPRGKRVKIGTAQKELIPGKWYFLHNPRNPNQHASEFDQDGVIQYAGGFVTDQGIGSSLILSAKTIINDVSNSNGVLTDDYLPSMVRFVAVDSIEGAFNIQFGTGNWLALAEGDSGTRLQTITNDSHNAGLSGLYNFYLVTVNGEPNTAGRFGWNKYNMANRIDNNGGGNSVNFWSEGEIIAEELNSYIAEEGHASIKGNMIWQIYDIISLDEDYFDTDESDHGTPFSFVTPDSGNTYYMYHPVKKKFFNKNGLLTEEAVDPIYFEEGAYTWTLRAYFDDEHNINTNNEGEIVISDWKTADASNSFMFVVNNTFDTADLDNKLGIPHNYKITYMVDEEPYQVDTVLSGSKIIPIEEPTKEGHTFSGWQNVPDTMPIHDITIKGSFIINTYEVTFKIGDEVIASDSIEYGAKVETPQVAEKEGHTFNGWKDVPETMPANDIVIVGDYSVNKYLLTFKIGDEVLSADSVEYGANVETPKVAEKEGHTFNGWENVPETMPANDIVVVGSYTVNIYKVYYYVGDELVHTEEVAYGDNIPSYEYTPTNGDKFMGWEGEQYDTMPAHDVTYIANIESGILYINGDMSEYQIYDLNGRKIENAKSLKSGVYIVNGKKTIVKAN